MQHFFRWLAKAHLILFNPAGEPITDDRPVTENLPLSQVEASIAGAPFGYVIAWHDAESDGDDYGVLVRRLDPWADPLDDEPVVVNTVTEGWQNGTAVAVSDDGSFAVALRTIASISGLISGSNTRKADTALGSTSARARHVPPHRRETVLTARTTCSGERAETRAAVMRCGRPSKRTGHTRSMMLTSASRRALSQASRSTLPRSGLGFAALASAAAFA